jgi:ABC-type dipeptide/oligopeptide/nickel transport system permease subunit
MSDSEKQNQILSSESILYLSLPYFIIIIAIICIEKIEKILSLIALGILWTVFVAVLLHYLPSVLRAVDRYQSSDSKNES